MNANVHIMDMSDRVQYYVQTCLFIVNLGKLLGLRNMVVHSGVRRVLRRPNCFPRFTIKRQV